MNTLSNSALPGASLSRGLWHIRIVSVNLDHDMRGVSRDTDWLMHAPSKNMTTPTEVAVTAEASSGSGSVADHRPNLAFEKMPVKIRRQSIVTLPTR